MKDPQELERLFTEVQRTQDAFWKALSRLERALECEIDNTDIDFREVTLQELIDAASETKN